MGREQFLKAMGSKFPMLFWEAIEPLISESKETVNCKKFSEFLSQLMGQASTMKQEKLKSRILGNTSKKMKGLLSPPPGAVRNHSMDFQQKKLLAYLQFRIEEKYRSLACAFRAFDKDYDGLLNFSEFREGLQQLGLRLPDGEINVLFQIIEQTKNKGGIDLQEFCSIDGLGIVEKKADLKSPMSPRGLLMKSRDPNLFNRDVQSQSSSLSKMWRHKMGYQLPSHNDQTYRYGNSNLHDHNMTALMTNQFQREYKPPQQPKQTKMRSLREVTRRNVRVSSDSPSTPQKLKKFRTYQIKNKPPVPSHIIKRSVKLPQIENIKLL